MPRANRHFLSDRNERGFVTDPFYAYKISILIVRYQYICELTDESPYKITQSGYSMVISL